MAAKRRHFSYANVVATLALVLSVGGVSYAAVRLPARSVGSSQLRSGAVVPRTLGFPLGARTKVDNRLHKVLAQPGCEPVNGTAPPCIPPTPQTLTSMSFEAKRGGKVAISGLLGLTLPSPGSREVRVTVSGKLDGKLLPGTSTVTVPGGVDLSAESQLAFLSGARVSPGTHRLSLQVVAAGSSPEIRVSPVSLSALVLP